MERRYLGATDLSVSVIGFGCAALGSRASRRDSINAIMQAAELGINFFDTAPFYGQGQSERILGTAFKKARDRTIIATKVGLYPNLALRLAARLKPVVRAVLRSLPGGGQKSLQKSVQGFMRSSNKVSFDRRSLTLSVESSLRRLRFDYIDLLLLHVTPDHSQIDDVVDQLQILKQQGKIRHFGASTHSDEDIALWLSKSGSGIAALQVMLNLFQIPTMDTYLPAAQDAKIGIIAREPFAQGKLLPPKMTAAGSEGLAFLGQAYDARFTEFASRVQRTVPQLAIQFLLQYPGVHSVLSGMSTVAHLRENVSALSIPPLTAAESQKLRKLAVGDSPT